MIRAFFDTSALFSAIVSADGGSRELLKRHHRGEISLVMSDYVRLEVERNLSQKVSAKAGVMELLIDLLDMEIVHPQIDDVRKAMNYVEAKDAPIIAAALIANCTHLLTFDKQHLLGNENVAKESGLLVMTPGSLLQSLNTDN
ncbi:MAG: PIN domain-containing protein [Aggregatilineales bacterium]